MNEMREDDPFYIGYLPQAPAPTASFVRRVLAALAIGALSLAAIAAVTLPYFGAGEFEFGRPREFRGTLRCDVAPRLVGSDTDYLLVGEGKHRVSAEICGASGNEVALQGTLIRRDGRQLIEIASSPRISGRAPTEPSPTPLGRVTLVGEIVDSKCYFGVMNPAEGRSHRACAELCLRGGIPAVFVARDRTGASAHLILTGPNGESINESLRRWVGESVEASGEVLRRGKWLIWQIDPGSVRRV